MDIMRFLSKFHVNYHEVLRIIFLDIPLPLTLLYLTGKEDFHAGYGQSFLREVLDHKQA